MMTNSIFRSWWVIGLWTVAAAAIVMASIARGASASTIALLVAVAVVPVIVVASLTDRASSSPTVAQILHPEQSQDGR
jgi:hypothetical protein